MNADYKIIAVSFNNIINKKQLIIKINVIRRKKRADVMFIPI